VSVGSRCERVMAAGCPWAIYAHELVRLRRLCDSPRGWPQPSPTELVTPKRKAEETNAT
jgi:hypothetical protein